MTNVKTRLVLFLCFAFAVWMLIRGQTERTSTNAPSIASSTTPPIARMCSNSNDSRFFDKFVFNASSVCWSPPASFNAWIQNKSGFEVGGPSHSTWGLFGIYEMAAKVDVTNFAAETLWEKGLREGAPFIWKDQAKGTQYLRDAVDLKGIADQSYDFVMASHLIEHIANPLKALLEWLRILRVGGFLLVIAPLKYETFDHRRATEKLEHLIDDYHRQTSEADLTHLEEILRTHDIGRDPGAKSPELFKLRSAKNLENRGLHQHVYDQELLYQIFICFDIEVITQCNWSNNHLIVGKKK